MFKSEYFLIVTTLLLTTFFKALTWIAVVPIWHTPDEQAHFATIQNLAEGVIRPGYTGLTHSEELLISERFLGTERGSKRVNRFTFNPGYKIEYVSGPVGQYEEEIKNLPKSTRTNMLEKEAASYYPLYYQIGKIIYPIFYNADLFVRVYAVRLFSILPILAITFFSYLTAREIFEKEKYLHLVIPILVSFHPMVTFINAGVTNDGVNILLFTAFLYFAIFAIKNGLDFRNLVAMAAILGLGQITRPQFLVTLPLFLIVFLYDFFANKRKILESLAKILIFVPIMLLFGGWFTVQKAFGNLTETGIPIPYYESGQPSTPVNLNLLTHLKNSLIQFDQQTFYWYWGVFKWLSLVYPAIVNQILKGISFLAGIGVLLWFLKILKEKEFSKTTQAILFLLFASILTAFAVFFVDWRHIVTQGFSLGVQGRYFLPTVLAHMILLAIGILALMPTKFKKFAGFILAFGMIFLNTFALFWLTNSYYYIGRGDLLAQLSQYKPIFFKYPIFLIYFVFYFLSLIFLVWQLIKVSVSNKQ